MRQRPGPREAARIVQMAGGEIVGRTRLQKTACILELSGADLGFRFDYHFYGPYSEQLNLSIEDAKALGLVRVKDCMASWGGTYSVYSTSGPTDQAPSSLTEIASLAASADSIELELAVTAAFLAKTGSKKPWDEVAARKSSKATSERMTAARKLYQRFLGIRTPSPLPKL